MEQQNYTIVVIEDDPLVNSTVKEILSKKYSKVITYTDAQVAQDEFHLIGPDLVLLDIFLGHANGLDILEMLRKLGYTMPVIMMTAFSDIKMAVRAMKLGAEDFIVKPLDLEQLEVAVEKALDNYDLRRQVDLLSEKLREEQPNEILGNYEGMNKAIDTAKIIASADTTAILLGESGTGKELIARYIHDNSNKAKGPFVTINCGAIPRELAENELFGYERGAFTGATEKIRPGKFEQANRGTILLDEISELSMELQVKLLRVLQERSFYRLGGTKEISVDVRVIASSNQELEKLVEEGKFREDLFYRLNVARVFLPPLKERGADIMLMAKAFVKEFNKKFNKNVKGFSPDAIDIINNYQWKGNVRELRNVIERIILLESGDLITRESLSFLKTSPGQAGTPIKAAAELGEGQHYLQIAKNGVTMGNVVRDLIIQTLNITNGNQIKAAKLLGISRAKLRYRIEQLGINITGKNIT
ncbi:MAG: sigma-54-dependent Fis family transcriptional regulator [Ignavibacteria bacterium GWB2_35_12]|nr:MAG: sigma-54-dependent Fis family transcriptional regulator [Ignavibacteria bacterium GWA2_35_8]OGU41576.1 MAG: sigma-54-dependent Fis family transcriptional regulator [Ignavibacteria bacterium GWB2_35_12]OGU86970.1 MAG: sigma-54-dependent Fis family transcriptional regulator [Ignavibacteria bacterium RIFOXYA2_FULL_35_10]OGV24909.1 MAG: sigma-54-dependent Fis family transcriptional regulator [Ignavibacteria bacterium RIFOXYC2_FULL_35_21]